MVDKMYTEEQMRSVAKKATGVLWKNFEVWFCRELACIAPPQNESGVRDAVETTINDWAILMDLDMEAELEVLRDNLIAALTKEKS